MKKTSIIVISIVAVTAGIIGYCSLNCYDKEITLVDEQADFTVTSTNITREFLANPKSANKKYTTRVVVIQGVVSEVHGNEVIVDENIICQLKVPNLNITPNQLIVIKGRIVAYDDFMGELKLENCFKM